MNRRLILIVIVVFAVLCIISVVVSVIFQSMQKNEYGNEVVIQNYNQKVKNLSKERRDAIFTGLYGVVKRNSSDNVILEDIKDAVIRDGSNLQENIQNGKEYTGSFIIDIESIKQSYGVSYIYPTGEEQITRAGYTIIVRCLDKSDLKYGDFECTDKYMQLDEGADPIFQYLPYSTLDYEIKSQVVESKTILKVKLFISESDLRYGEAAAVERYKNEALDWIRSKGLKPEDYTIEYTH